MRVADKIYTTLLQRQAAPKETGDKPKADAPRRDAQATPSPTQGGRPTTDRPLETLSHPAARTLDALIRDQVLSLARDAANEKPVPQEKERIEALASSLAQSPGADAEAILTALREREDAMLKAANQNTRLFSPEFREFLR